MNMTRLVVVLCSLLSLQLFSRENSFYELKRVNKNKIQVRFKLDSGKYRTLNGKRKSAFLSSQNFIDMPGTPAIPFVSLLVKAKPQNLTVNIKKNSQQRIRSPRVSKYQKSVYNCRCSSPKMRKRAWSNEDYKVLSQYQASFAVEYLGDFRGEDLTQVTVYPVNYKRDEDSLDVFPDLTMTMESESARPLEVMELGKELGYTIPANLDIKPRNNNLLIVTPRRFKDSLDRFVRWKKTVGFDVELVEMEDLGRSASQIRKGLQSLYKKTRSRTIDRGGFSYAILVGNEKVFPTFYRETSFDDRTGTDLPYFTYGGEEDFIPDVFYGRFVVSTNAELEGQIDKIIEYEKSNHRDFNGLKNGLMIASNEGDFPSDEEIVEFMQNDFGREYESRFVYLMESKGNAVAGRINDALEKGSFWVTYLGHGEGYRWSSTNDNYGVDDIMRLKATQTKPVIVDIACENGRLLPGFFGERFMNAKDRKNRPIGATAYIGASVSITWEPPAIMAMGMNLVKKRYDLANIGQVLMGGQFYLAQNWDYADEVKENMAWFHIFGDPTMILRMAPPKKIKMRKSGTRVVSFSTSEGSLKNHVVVFHNKKDKFFVSKTNSAGAVTVPNKVGADYISILSDKHQYLEESVR